MRDGAGIKVRIGYGVSGFAPLVPATLEVVTDGLEELGFDSLWLSERLGAAGLDPIAALAFAAGRTRRIKVGTSVSVLPGRNPAVVAKQWATLALISQGRALPAFGLGVVDPNEQQAFGVRREDRASMFDEMLPLLRRLWTETEVTHDGRWFHYDALRVEPKPPKALDVWLGGKAPSELRRVGRLGDGWIASFATPEECAASRPVVEQAAADAGRAMDPEHYGAMVFYSHGRLPDAVAERIAARNPDVDPHHLVPAGFDAVRTRCEEFVAVGFSKLVLVPFSAVTDWRAELAEAAAHVVDLQT
jgi:probable F420-dependent oxidoreductase